MLAKEVNRVDQNVGLNRALARAGTQAAEAPTRAQDTLLTNSIVPYDSG